MPKQSKIKHDYKCDVCGRPATQNIQNWWYSYTIDSDGDFYETGDWAGDTNEFFCDDCN